MDFVTADDCTAIVGFFKPGISFKALKYIGHVLYYTERLRLDFVVVSKSNETFFCARNYMLKVFKERALSFEVL